MATVAIAEPIGHGWDSGPTGHCKNGRHVRCPYRVGGELYPEIALTGGDTYSCPCRCHQEAGFDSAPVINALGLHLELEADQ